MKAKIKPARSNLERRYRNAVRNLRAAGVSDVAIENFRSGYYLGALVVACQLRDATVEAEARRKLA